MVILRCKPEPEILHAGTYAKGLLPKVNLKLEN
jgi:hypothetical protein